MARVLEIEVRVDASQAKRELTLVDSQLNDVEQTGRGKLGSMLDAVDSKWSKLTTGLSNARGALNQVAEQMGITVGQLGLMNSALLAVGTAATSYQLTRGLLNLVGVSERLDKSIGDSVANLIGWSDKAVIAAAKQDTMALASTRAHRVILDYNEAIRVNQEFVDDAVRKRAPEELARQIESWRGEIAKVQAAGALPSLKEQLDLHTKSTKQLAETYRISEGAINLYKTQLSDEATKHREAEAAAKKHTAEEARFREELERHTDAAKKVEAGFIGLHESVGVVDNSIIKFRDDTAKLTAELYKVESTAHLANFGFKGMSDGLENIGQKVRDLGPDIQHQFVGPLQEGAQIGKGVIDELKGAFGDFAKGFSPSGLFHNLMSSGLSSIFGPSGLLTNLAMEGFKKLGEIAWEGLKKVGGFFKDLFGGPSAKELGGRQVVQEFEQNLAKMLDGTELIEAGGEQWKMTIIAIRDAYLENGRTEAEALADAKLLWDSAKLGPDAVRAIIEEITQKMNTQVPAAAAATAAALQGIPRDIRIHVGYDVDQAPDVNFAARGGYVTPGGVQYLARGGSVLPFRARGSDTVPAMLTPGEGVLNRGAMRRLGGPANLHYLNAGGTVGGTTVEIGSITVEQGMTEQEAETFMGKTIIQGMRKRGVRFSNR